MFSDRMYEINANTLLQINSKQTNKKAKKTIYVSFFNSSINENGLK